MSHHQATQSHASRRTTTGSSVDTIATVTWGGHTFQAPAWVDKDASTNIKNHYFEGRKAAISGLLAPHKDKLGDFVTRFVVGGTITHHMAHKTADLLNPDDPQLYLLNTTVFEFYDCEVHTSKERQVNMSRCT